MSDIAVSIPAIPSWYSDSWFSCFQYTADPWLYWLHRIEFPNCLATPHEAWIEHDIERLVRQADELRLQIEPATKRFAVMWLRFRQHHEGLEERGKYLRKRWMIWRGAALRVMRDYRMWQDEVDLRLLRAQLAEAMRYHGPYDENGDCGGINIWRPATGDSPVEEYAQMVLSLVRAAAGVGHRKPQVFLVVAA
jgi:hypothetical protein